MRWTDRDVVVPALRQELSLEQTYTYTVEVSTVVIMIAVFSHVHPVQPP